MSLRRLLTIGGLLLPSVLLADPNHDLVVAARDGNLADVQKALSAGAQIDAPGDLGDYQGIRAFHKKRCFGQRLWVIWMS